MIFVSADDKIAYYHAPKNGSRTMLGYLSLIRDPKLFEEYPHYFHPTDDEVYSQLRERVKRLGKHHYIDFQIPKAETEFRVVVKRDPVKRFISGYTNRVLHHKKLAGIQPSISEFIDNFSFYRDKYSDIETHFMPQTNFFGKDPNIYTHIFDTKELGIKVRELFQEVYGRPFPDLRLQQGGNKNKIELTKEQENWIKDYYELDYKHGWC